MNEDTLLEIIQNQTILNRKILYRLKTIQNQLDLICKPLLPTPIKKYKSHKILKSTFNSDEQQMTLSACATYLKISKTKLNNLSINNQIPFKINHKGHRVYNKTDLNKWIIDQPKT